jgi:choline transporter-like protein 2/4/5
MSEENNTTTETGEEKIKVPPPPPNKPPPNKRASENAAITEDELINATDDNKKDDKKKAEDEKPKGPEPIVERVEFDDFEDKRSCTDMLCCLLFLVFIAGWGAVIALGFIYGRPYSLIYAVDYNSNICSRPCESTSTSTSCPSNIGSLKLGFYPRIVSDLIEQRTTIAAGEFPTFYTVCVNKCPEKGQILCDYEFNAKYDNPLSTSVSTTANIIQCLQATSPVPRYVESTVPGTVANILSVSSVADQDFCAEVYNSCDYVTTQTKSVFNRCLPVPSTAQINVTERCVYPLTTEACLNTSEISARNGEFTTDCVYAQDDSTGSDGYFKPLYEPTRTDYQTYHTILLAGDAKTQCVQKQVYTEEMKEEMPQNDELQQLVDQANEYLSYFGDVIKAQNVIIGMGLAAPVLLACVWVMILRFCTKVIVWGTLIILELGFLAAGLLCLIQVGVIDISAISAEAAAQYAAAASAVDTTSYDQYMTIVGYVFLILALIILLQMIFMRSAINTAIDVIKLATMALGSMPQLQLFPFVTYTSLAILLAFFAIVQCLLMTAKDISATDIASSANTALSSATGSNSTLNVTLVATSQAATQTSAINYLYSYHLFGLLWSNAFIQGVGIMTIAGAVSKWYWAPFDIVTEDTDGDGDIDENDKKVKKAVVTGFPVAKSFWRTLRYHMGSIAFGSLIIAIVQAIRIVFAYITKQAEGIQGESKIKKIILAIINCMLWCLEKCVKFISKNSYIYTAIKGTSFCWSAFQSFRLIFNNLARFGMTTGISEVILFLCKLTVIVGSGVGGYAWINYDPTYQTGELAVARPIIAYVIIIICAYIVATSFFNVVDLSIDTILLNYCLDLKRKAAGKALAADQKLGKMPLGDAKDDGKEEDAGDMDVGCCKACACFNPFVKKCCCDEKKKKRWSRRLIW